jgi:hypothetical protein
MGRISAEEYYNQLEAINKKYYKGKSKYLDEYRSLEEKVYNGRKSLSSTDKWKEKAEDEISAVEHSYKMGEISATEYYNKLDKINQKYYANKSEYLEEYNDLAEKVYEGRKKEEEDEVKNAQDLVDKLKAVKEAEDDLTNAKKQKVKVYSSSAGFHVESDSTAISEAQDSLSEANSNLNSLLYSMGLITASQATASVSSILKSVDLSEISSSLPNLSGLKLTSTGSSSSTAEKSYNINVTYNAGDIKISGSADSTTVNKITSAMEKDIKTLFEKFIREYFSKANLTRMIGG